MGKKNVPHSKSNVSYIFQQCRSIINHEEQHPNNLLMTMNHIMKSVSADTTTNDIYLADC